MLYDVKNGQTSVILRVKLRNSSVTTGAGLTGLTSASTGLRIGTIADNEATSIAYTVAGATIESITTLGTYAAPTATKCRFKEVDATNHPGLYEVQLADARFAVASAKSLTISFSGATNLAECDVVVPLRSVNPYDANYGLANLDAAVSTRSVYAGGAVSNVTGNVGGNVMGSVVGSVGSIAGVTFPGNFGALSVDTSGNIKIQGSVKKNAALAGFQFYMALASDHVSPATGKSITATRSLNGGAFQACAAAATEIGAGWYTIDLAASDLNGNTVALSFAASASDTTVLTLVTQP